MDKGFPKRIYQDENFIVNGFSGKKIEFLTGFESEKKLGSPVIIYLKAKGKKLQRFFLDVGIGFWEEGGTIEDENEEGFVLIDYTIKFKIQNEKITNIYCEKVQNNSRIVIALENKTCILLCYKNAEIIDSDIELIKVKRDKSKIVL